MALDQSGEFTTNADIATRTLHRTEHILRAPQAEPQNDKDPLLESCDALNQAIDHLDNERRGALTQEAIAAIDLKQAALWHCYAETERLRLAHAITLHQTDTGVEATIDDTTRNNHMHEIREGLRACWLSLTDAHQHNPAAIIMLRYLTDRTLGIAELTNALSTPPYSRTTRQLFRAKRPLESALLTLADYGLKPDIHRTDDNLSQDQKNEQREARANQDPGLYDAWHMLTMAETGNRTYTEEPLPPSRHGILTLAGLRLWRPKPKTRHMLEHPAFSAPAPIKTSQILQL